MRNAPELIETAHALATGSVLPTNFRAQPPNEKVLLKLLDLIKPVMAYDQDLMEPPQLDTSQSLADQAKETTRGMVKGRTPPAVAEAILEAITLQAALDEQELYKAGFRETN